MHAAHLAQGELVLILLDEGHDHVLDELSLHLSKLHLTAYCAAMHLDRSCDHPCDNELRLPCAVRLFVELLGDHHHGTNGRSLDDHDLLEDDHYSDGHDLLNHHDHTTDDHRDQLTDGHYLDDLDLLADDPLNHHDHTTDDHRDHRDLRDQPTDGHYLDDLDLLADDPLNHHDHTTDDLRDLRDLPVDDRYLGDHDLLEDDLLNHHGYTTDDHRDLLTDDHDLGHHFARMQDDLLDDYLDGLDVRHDLLMDDRDCPKDDHGPRLVCLNDHRHRRDALYAKVCQILLPVADDVDRDFQGLALDEVYLQSTAKHRTYARWY
jgi:hypothetical protein